RPALRARSIAQPACRPRNISAVGASARPVPFYRQAGPVKTTASMGKTQPLVSLFADRGYSYDVSGGKKYYGSDIGLTVDIYAAAFPDMHRELDRFYIDDNVVIVELSLN